MLGLVFIALFVIFFLIALFLKFSPSNFENNLRKKKKEDFEIVITSLNEDEEIVKETIKSWLPIKKKIYLLRDGFVSSNLKSFLEENAVVLVKRSNSKDGKAGALNNYLENYCSSPWFFLVDVDERLVSKENLYKLFDSEADIIVSKKEFEEKGFLGKVMNLTNSIFSIVQMFSSSRKKALFNGSCAFIKSDVAKSLLFRDFAIEDIEFSLRAIKSSYSIIFENIVVARGREPSFTSFIMQHSRYSYGNGELIKNYFFDLIKDNEMLLLLLFLPLFSLFQVLLILYAIISFDCLPIVVEFIFSYLIFFLYLNLLDPLLYIAVFLLNMFLLPFFRAYYFILALIKKKEGFPTTL